MRHLNSFGDRCCAVLLEMFKWKDYLQVGAIESKKDRRGQSDDRRGHIEDRRDQSDDKRGQSEDSVLGDKSTIVPIFKFLKAAMVNGVYKVFCDPYFSFRMRLMTLLYVLLGCCCFGVCHS